MSDTLTAGLTEDELDQLIHLLGKVQQPWPADLAEAIMALVPVNSFEGIMFRRNPRDSTRPALEVYLARRPDNDIHWPGQLNIPGTIMRATDQPLATPGRPLFSGVLDRLARKEFGLNQLHQPELAEIVHAGESGRANALQFVYITFMHPHYEPTGGEWYDARNLPDNLVAGQAEIITRAVLKYGHKRPPAI